VEDYDLTAELDQRQMSDGVDDEQSDHDRRGEKGTLQEGASVRL
jgi:hypothetical protein